MLTESLCKVLHPLLLVGLPHPGRLMDEGCASPMGDENNW